MGEHKFDPSLPVINLDFQLLNHSCASSEMCERYIKNDLSRSIGREAPVGWIDLRNLSYEEYMAKIKKRFKSSKSSSFYDAKKADKQGYVCKMFERRLFVPDQFDINQSKEERGGSKIKGYFQSSIEHLGGLPQKYTDVKLPNCPIHYLIYWGLFSPEPGYKQGEVLTNERLLAYAFVRRIGNVAVYSQLVGHGDFLKYGIVYRLHFAIMEWMCKREDAYTQGIEHFMHGRYHDGGEGRMLWRKKTCFEPAYLIHHK